MIGFALLIASAGILMRLWHKGPALPCSDCARTRAATGCTRALCDDCWEAQQGIGQ